MVFRGLSKVSEGEQEATDEEDELAMANKRVFVTKMLLHVWANNLKRCIN